MTQPRADQTSERHKLTHLARQDAGAQVPHGDLELPVTPLDGDLDGDERVHGDGHGGRHDANTAALSS